jgi:hypothetical protein
MAHLAYFDESGDPGLVNSPTKHYVLSCILVPETEWLNTLDHFVQLRGHLRNKLGASTRPELKATDIIRARGPLKGLRTSPADRVRLFGILLNRVGKMPGLKTFAIAIEKAGASGRGYDPREAAWQFALQRVDKFCAAADSRAILFPDEGHEPFIRKLTRRLRRFQTINGAFGGRLTIPMRRVIEDPNDRHSHDSYFIQAADWVAYAAHRSRYVAPSSRVPPTLWDRLGGALLLEVNRVRGGPPGLVVYP